MKKEMTWRQAVGKLLAMNIVDERRRDYLLAYAGHWALETFSDERFKLLVEAVRRTNMMELIIEGAPFIYGRAN